jgi:catechol 2,3-dioxygenase-like lactoylglutathione lyase family enzyme
MNMKIRRIDHVGIVVDDLHAVKAFFLDLGLTTMEEGDVVGIWVKKITGLRDTGLTYTMLRTPDGETSLELIKFHGPSDETDAQHNSAKSLGIRHICFSVENIEAVVAKMEKKGAELLGEIVNFDNAFKLCYLRGPEGIILELTEQLQ